MTVNFYRSRCDLVRRDNARKRRALISFRSLDTSLGTSIISFRDYTRLLVYGTVLRDSFIRLISNRN